jgi:hypothetical protein
MGVSGWGSATKYINEAIERKKQEEEEERRQETRDALDAFAEQQRRERSNPTPAPQQGPLSNPWKRPTFSQPVQREEPERYSSPYSSPPLDTSAPMLDSSRNESGTRQSRVSQPLTPAHDSSYDVPNQWQVQNQQDDDDEEQRPTSSPWRPISSWGTQPSLSDNVRSQAAPRPYQLQPDEMAPTNYDRRRNVFNNQPEPIQNRIGNAIGNTIGGGFDAAMDWWQGTPEQDYHQAQSERRRATSFEELPSVGEAMQQGNQALQGSWGPLGVLATGLGAGIGAANRTEIGRNIILGAQDALSGFSELGATMHSSPWLQGFSPSEIINADLATLNEALLDVTQPGYNPSEKKGFFSHLDEFRTDRLTESNTVRKRVNEMVEQGNKSANIALRLMNTSTGAVQAYLGDVNNKEENIARLEEEGNALAGSDPVLASEKFRQAEELRAMDNLDMLEARMSPLAEFAYGMVFDVGQVVSPFIGILGILPEAQALRRATRAKNVTPDQAIARLSTGAKEGADIAKTFLQEGPAAAQKKYKEWNNAFAGAGTPDVLIPFQKAGKAITDISWLFARTNESKAAIDTEVVWQGISAIFSGITDKGDARRIAALLPNNLGQLVKGVAGLSTDAMQRLGQSDGVVKWGSGLLGDNDFVRRSPVFKLIENELNNLASLQGTGNFIKSDFLAEMNGVIVEGFMRLNGGKQPTSLPFGAADVKMRVIGPDSAIVDYVDAKGRIVQRGVEVGVAEAQRRIEAIQKALKPGGKGIVDWVALPAQIQRNIMSDWWLGLRPANWIGNALGASVNLFAGDAYTLLPNTDIQDYFSAKTGGGGGNRRMFGITPGNDDLTRTAKGEVTSGAIDATASALAKLFGSKDGSNPVSSFMRGAYNIPYGSTEIKLPGGLAIPFGEEAFYSRAYYVPFQRTFNADIAKGINEFLVPRLQQIEGVTPQVIQNIGSWVQAAAESGGKGDVMEVMRNLVGKPGISMTLKQIGVPKELLLPQHSKAIEWLLMDAAPSQADQVMKNISRILAQARRPAGELLNLSPAQAGISNWTDIDLAQEAAWVADTLTKTAKKAGMDVATAAEEGRKLAQTYINGQEGALNRVVQDLAGAANTPDTWSVTVDFWIDAQKAKVEARQLVDEAGELAAQLNTPEAWQQKWTTTKQTYEALAQKIAKSGEDARLALQQTLGGQLYTPKHDWYETIEDYIRFDEQEFLQSRNIVLGRAADADPAEFKKVIDANRAMLDNALYELIGTFQKYPSLENFDLVREGFRKVQVMGAQVRSKLDELLAQGMSGDEYAKARNQAWNNYFDAGATYNRYLGETVVYNGLVNEAGANLKWTEGDVEFTLVRPSETKGKWIARRSDNGKEEEFTVADTATEVSPLTVPKSVVTDWQRTFGDEKLLDDATTEVMAEIEASAPEVLRPTPEAAPTSTLSTPLEEQMGDDMDYLDLGGVPERDVPVPAPQVWTEPLTEQSAPGYNGYRSAEPLPQEIPAAGDMPDAGIPPVRSLPDDPDAPGYVPPAEGSTPGLSRPKPRQEMPTIHWEDTSPAPQTRPAPTLPQPTPRTAGRYTTTKGTGGKSGYTDAPDVNQGRKAGYTNEPPPVRGKGYSNGERLKAERDAASEAYTNGAPKAEPTVTVTPTPAPTSTPTPTVDLTKTKKQLVDEYGDQLRQQGLTDARINKMSKGEIAKRIENPVSTPAPSTVAKPTSTGDMAKSEIDGLKQLRKDMATAWNKELGNAQRAGTKPADIVSPGATRKNKRGGTSVAKPPKEKSERFPGIDTYVMRHGQGGVVNLNLDKGELRDFDDLFGQSIMGQRIDNIDDVQRFLQQYQDLGKQIDSLQGTVSKSKTFAKMSVPEIIADTRRQLLDAGFSDAEITALAKQNRRSVLDIVESVRGEKPDDINMVAYDFAVPSASHLLGVESDDSLRSKNFRDWFNKSRKTGNNTAPQMGEVAEHTIQSINELEQYFKKNIRSILQGQPNQLTGAQQLRIIDEVQDWLPQFDNSVSKAQRVADRMAGWMMLNYQDRRNIDSIMGLLMPYSYFWSRMPSRVLMNGLAKPGIVNLYYEANRAVDLENDQAGVPDRHRGSLPNPLNQFGIGGERINVMAAMRYAIPAQGYIQANPFIEEDETDNQAEKWAKELQKWVPGLFPTHNMLLDLADGKLDKDYSSVLNNMMPIPLVGIPISTAQQGLSGVMPSRDGVAAKMGFGPDEFDPYRARRAVAWIGQEEGIDPTMLGFASQVIVNQYEGNDPSFAIPEQYLEEATALATRGIQRAAGDRAVGRATAYTTMMGVNPWPESEQEMQRASDRWRVSGYNPLTGTGSKELQKAQLEADPSAKRSWTKSSDTPGVDAQISLLYEEAYRTGEWDRINPLIEELKAQQTVDPNAPPKDPTKGMTPEEVTAAETKASASTHWDAYHELDKKDGSRAEYLRDNPDFVEIYDANEVKQGREIDHWWEEDSTGAKATGATTTRTPVEGGEDITYKDVKDVADAFWDLNGSKDWDAQMQILADNPDFAEYEWRRKLAKDGELPWWYDEYYGEEGAPSAQAEAATPSKGPPPQPVYNPLPGNKLGEGATVSSNYYSKNRRLNPLDQGVRTGMAESSSVRQGIPLEQYETGGAYGANWDEYKALGDNNDAKRQYMLDNPEFAAYYTNKYGEGSDWWNNSGGYKEYGRGGGREWSKNYDEYESYGNDYEAKHRYMQNNPRFAAYEYARIKNKYGEEPWWSQPYSRPRTGGYSYYGGGGGGSPWLGGGGGGSRSQQPALPPAPVQPRFMSRELEVPSGRQGPWIPYSNSNPEWLMSGRDIAPEPIRPWQPPRFS